MDVFTDDDLNPAALPLLQFLADNGPTPVDELADEFAVEEEDVEATLDALGEEGLVHEEGSGYEASQAGLAAIAAQEAPEMTSLEELEEENEHQPVERELESAGFALDQR